MSESNSNKQPEKAKPAFERIRGGAFRRRKRSNAQSTLPVFREPVMRTHQPVGFSQPAPFFEELSAKSSSQDPLEQIHSKVDQRISEEQRADFQRLAAFEDVFFDLSGSMSGGFSISAAKKAYDRVKEYEKEMGPLTPGVVEEMKLFRNSRDRYIGTYSLGYSSDEETVLPSDSEDSFFDDEPVPIWSAHLASKIKVVTVPLGQRLSSALRYIDTERFNSVRATLRNQGGMSFAKARDLPPQLAALAQLWGERAYLGVCSTLTSPYVAWIVGSHLPSQEDMRAYLATVGSEFAIFLVKIHLSYSENGIRPSLFLVHLAELIRSVLPSVLWAEMKNTLWGYVSQLFSMPEAEDSERGPFGIFIQKLSMLKDGIVDFTGCGLYFSMMKLISATLSAGVAFKLGLAKQLVWYLPSDFTVAKRASGYDITSSILGSLVDFLESGYQHFVLNVPVSMIHGQKSYTAWIEEKEKLLVRERSLNTDEVSLAEFQDDVNRVYRQGIEIRRMVAKTTPHAMGIIQREMQTISEIHTRYVVLGDCNTRPQPPLIALVGFPGVGKTAYTSLIFKLFSDVCNPSILYDGKHSVVSSIAKFDDVWIKDRNGYLVLDDLGALQLDSSKDPTEDFKRLIGLTNNAAYALNCSDVADKNKGYRAAPQAIIATSNQGDLGARLVFASPSAMARRVNAQIVVSVRPEFRIENSHLADPEKVVGLPVSETTQVEINVPHLSSGTLRSKKGNYDLGYSWETVYSGPWTSEDGECGSSILGRLLNTHWVNQRDYQNKIRTLAETKYCSTCFRLESVCKCEPEDSDDSASDDDKSERSSSNPAESPDKSEPLAQAEGAIPEQAYWTALGLALPFLYKLLLWIVSTWHKVASWIRDDWLLSSPSLRIHDSVSELRETVLFANSLADQKLLLVQELLDQRINYFSVLGQQVHDSIWARVGEVFRQARKVLLALLGGGALYLAAASVFKKHAVAEGSIPSTLRSRLPYRRPAKNIYDDTPKPIVGDFSQATRTSTYAEVESHIAKAVYRCTYYYGDKKFLEGVVFAIGCSDFLGPAHSFKRLKGDVSITIHGFGSNGADISRTVSVRHAVYDGDRVLFRLSGLVSTKNLIKFMTVKHGNERFSGVMLDPEGHASVVAGYRDSCRMYANDVGGVLVTEDHPLVYNFTRRGACGSPLVRCLPSGGLAIVAMHIAGFEGEGYGLPLTQAGILDMVSRLNDACKIPFVSSVTRVDTTQYSREIAREELAEAQGYAVSDEIHYKSFVHFRDMGPLEIIGDVNIFPGVPRTDVHPSMIKTEVDDFYEAPSLFAPPIMRRGFKTRNGEKVYIDPVGDSVVQISQGESLISPDLVETAAVHYLARLKRFLPSEALPKKPLSDHQAINGIPGSLKGMNRHTSGGFNMLGKKSTFPSFAPADEPVSATDLKFLPFLQSHADELWEKMAEGTVGPVFQLHPKNEPRKIQDTGFVKKTRIFGGAPVAWCHNVRRLMAPIFELMQTYQLAFEVAIGANAMSHDWDVIYRHVSHFGTSRIIAGDYKNYDKHMPAVVTMYSHWVYSELLVGYDDIDLARFWSAAFDSAFPIYMAYTLLVRTFCSFPSGHPGTVNVNSTNNSILVRVAWMLCGYPIEEFDNCVSFLSYGDDNIMSVREDIDFTHWKLAEAIGKMGMIYTLPDKTTRKVDFLDLDECDFLKRTFVLRDSRIYAPLSETSIQRSLSWIYDSSLTDEDQTIANMKDCQREYWQYGKPAFEKFSEWCRKTLSLHNLEFFERDLHNYETLSAKLETAYSSSDIAPVWE